MVASMKTAIVGSTEEQPPVELHLPFITQALRKTQISLATFGNALKRFLKFNRV